MAVFLENICKFDKCGKLFQTLPDLIIHIEECHINYDLNLPVVNGVVQSECLPLSYILRYDHASTVNQTETKDVINYNVRQRILQHAHKAVIPNSSCIMLDDGNKNNRQTLLESDGSNDSLSLNEMSPESLHVVGWPSANHSSDKMASEKPFACDVPGCHKRYKNINGIKYHAKNGHKDICVMKHKREYACFCGKSYKTAGGLRCHAVIHKKMYDEQIEQLSAQHASLMDFYKDQSSITNVDASNLIFQQNEQFIQKKCDYDLNSNYYNVINEVPYANTEIDCNTYYRIQNSAYIPRRLNF